MIQFVARRLTTALITVLAVIVLSGMLVRLVPGDAVLAANAYSGNATSEAMDEMRARLGLNRPIWMQVGLYALQVLSGDLGTTIRSNEPVARLLLERLPNTLLLAASGLSLALLFGLPLGAFAAIRRGTVADSVVTAISLVGASIPAFWLGFILIQIFSLELRWLPVAGTDLRNLILPALTLGLTYGALIARVARSALIDILEEDYIRTARARGLSERQVLTRHALRPALISILTMIGLIFAYLMGGQVIVENIFSWNGIGRLAVQAMLQRDYPMIQGFIVVFATSVIVVSMSLEIVYGLLDPRMRQR